MADATDSKSVDGDIVWVQVPPPAPLVPESLFSDSGYFFVLILCIIDKFRVSYLVLLLKSKPNRARKKGIILNKQMIPSFWLLKYLPIVPK